MARRARKVGYGLVALAALYVVALLLAGVVAEQKVADRIKTRLGDSLDAEVTVGDVEVSVISGRATIRDLKIRRDRGGLIEIDCPRIVVRFRAGGGYLFDRSLAKVTLHEPSLSVSALGAFALRRRVGEPLVIDELVVDSGKIKVLGSQVLPGLARVDLAIERARARNVVLKTGVSWVFGLDILVARASVGSALEVGVGYDGDTVSLEGALFGSVPLRIPFVMPIPDPDDLEPAQLRAVGTALAKKVGVAWFRREVSSRLRSLFD